MSHYIDTFNAWAESWWPYALHATWQAAGVALVILLLVSVARRWPSPLRYGLLVLALLKFALPPMLAVPTGLFSQVGPELAARQGPAVSVLGNASTTIASAQPAEGPPITAGPGDPAAYQLSPAEPATTSPSLVPASPEGDPADPSRAGADRPTAAPEISDPVTITQPGIPTATVMAAESRLSRAQSTAPRLTLQAWLMIVHAAGSAALAAWLAWQWLQLHRVLRQAQRLTDGPLYARFLALSRRLKLARSARLLVVPGDGTPFSCGLWRPTVVVPQALAQRSSSQSVQIALAHELAHHARGDLWINALQAVLCAIWWFNPFVWLMNRALRTVREECCDDLILAQNLAADDAYCAALLHVAAGQASPPRLALQMAAGPRQLARRICRIMDRSIHRPGRLSAHGWLPIELEKGREFTGRLTGQGDPSFRDVRLTATWRNPDANSTQVATYSDRLGRFVFPAVHPQRDFVLRAYMKAAPICDPVRLKADDKQPFSLRVHLPDLAPLAGRVIDRQGQPVAGVVVRVTASNADTPGIISLSIMDKPVTDREGRFTTVPLVRHGAYKAAAMDGDLKLAESDSLTPSEDGTTAFADLEVARGPEPAAVKPTLRNPVFKSLGVRIVDAAGQALGKAEVTGWFSGNRVRTTADANGRFRLSDVPEHGGFIFVSAKGCRFHGEYVQPAGEKVELVVPRLTDPPLPSLVTLPSLPAADDIAELGAPWFDAIERRELRVGDKSADIDDVQTAELMAQLDPVRSLEFLAEHPLSSDSSNARQKYRAARSLLKTDLEEGLVVVNSLADASLRSTAYRETADSLPPEARDRKLELLGMMAQSVAGTDKETAARLIEECFALLTDLVDRGDNQGGMACGSYCVAVALLPVVEAIDPNAGPRVLVAGVVAATSHCLRQDHHGPRPLR
ncbi:MAG: M56 family metallopeptidase [Pirellulales bacterium]